MRKVPLVEYDEHGTRSIVGDAMLEVVIQDGQLTVTTGMIFPNADLAQRLTPKINPGDFSTKE